MPHVETLRPGDYAASADLRRMAFGNIEPFDSEQPTIEEGRYSCVYEGDRLIAQARDHEFSQWFGGRAVACGGLSGVMVATDRRGAGLGRVVVADAIRNMQARGEVISSLFATTIPLYRSLGYEIAGKLTRSRVPIVDLPATAGDLRWEPSSYVATEARNVMRRAGTGNDGWVVRPQVDREWAEHRRRKNSVSSDIFLGRRGDDAVAVVAVEYAPSASSEFTIRWPLESTTMRQVLLCPSSAATPRRPRTPKCNFPITSSTPMSTSHSTSWCCSRSRG